MSKPAVAKNHGGPKGWMPSEWKLFFRNEDSYIDAAFTLDLGIAREYESSFLKVCLASQALHFGVAQTACVREHGKRVAF